MAVNFQVVIDCTNSDRLALFWASALHYDLETPPLGFATWDDYWRSVGVPEDEMGIAHDSIVDPKGSGPRIWSQVVPEVKTVKNRFHFDIHASGGRSESIDVRRQGVDAEAARLVKLGATVTRVLQEERTDHYAVAMKDPEGNEFDVN